MDLRIRPDFFVMAEQEENIEQVIERLTPKELRFCQLYAQYLNGARAAREAGYSPDSDRFIASENLTKPNIKRVVKYYLEEAIMPVEEAVKRLSDMGRGNFSPFLTEGGALDIDSNEARENIGLIKKVKQVRRMELGRGENVQKDYEILSTEIELHDAKDALKLLLEVHGKLVQKHEVYVPPTIVL